ncbi:transporter substrate-binding domain-containing protein [Roseomonas stagni]|uniref:Transporter substrate-binding domain-containing protein n=1 Tax=Falsiroseomonas algicola TaxID=2716930 RepID=A0A6M1LIY5_9PROT|nr:transporter substrate-binding domain-containing protein [Falsiroseomonas algicola]NGM20137.1 transporter substrate-binding domain-containing protein [Falsiroseomonas algicola]
MIRHVLAALLLALPAVAPAAAQNASPTLTELRARGELRCVVNGSLPGFSAPDAGGVMRGIDADFCRAVAAATLGDAGKVRFATAATVAEALGTLEGGSADIVARNATRLYAREAGRGLASAGTLYHDGMGFMVPEASAVTLPADLAGRRICISAAGGAATREALDFTIGTATIVEAPDGAAMVRALEAGQCDAAAADASQLMVRRVSDLARPAGFRVLPTVVTREPLGPFVRAGDAAWRSIVFWTLQAMLEAEELEAGSDNLLQAVQRNEPALWRLLGVEPGIGAALGLSEEWALQVIRQVGNYGEVFDRNLGAGSPFRLDRGLNDNWNRGGLHYPMPLR